MAMGTGQSAEDLLKKIDELEKGHTRLKQEMSKLIASSTAESGTNDNQKRLPSCFMPQQRDESQYQGSWIDDGGSPVMKLKDQQYLTILQSMGQAVHIYDLDCRIIYWNRSAENLYGYPAAEALGKDVIVLLTDSHNHGAANNIVDRVTNGDHWTGKFPVINRRGERFLALATNTPFYDDDGTLVGLICVSSDSRPFVEAKSSVVSKLYSSVSRSSTNNLVGEVTYKVASKKRCLEGNSDCKSVYGSVHSSEEVKDHNSSGTGSSGRPSRCNAINTGSEFSNHEILWEDLTIGQQIGQGSCGTVYRALWCGSDVAVKVFSRRNYSEDVRVSFQQEVSLMKRLRHPNILLFMGAVSLPQHLCIITEFLPRGSLFSLLQKKAPKLEMRRRILMALDIARSMSYLHHCNPPIIHGDLKSLNLLVDKNWTVKVGDFGLSQLKLETLTTETGAGTPQWMAPEILRNEPSDEKADIFSYGVVLWELITQKIPWCKLSTVQVIAAVGFMNQRLDIPKEVDAQWVSIIKSCWQSEPRNRPSFRELVEKLKEMQKHYAIQSQVSRVLYEDAEEKEQ